MARHLPGYGGHFRDEQGSLQVYLTQAAYVRSQELPVAMREKFKASMLTVYGADYSAGASFLPNGKPGEWNASESGHPHIFLDENGKTHLFFQGNNDNGKTWFISNIEVFWNEKGPFLKRKD